MSKVFEFHFNPTFARKKQGILFDTFCFSPETRLEAKLGYLYLLGEIKNFSSKDENLLSLASQTIKNGYYQSGKTELSESFKTALSQANEFLSSQTSRENGSCLDNLNFAVLSLTPDFLLRVSKTGNVKILVFTQGEVLNVGENINVASPGGKIFSNMAEGKLQRGNKILVLTDNLFPIFEQEKILERLTKIKKAKEIKKLLKQKKNVLREAVGAALLIFVKKQRRKLFFPVSKKQELRSPLLRRTKASVKSSLAKLPQKILAQEHSSLLKIKKTLFPLLVLVLLLLLGFLLFR